jgi:transcriptional regulator with XRE-family HTH domain
VTEQNTTEQIAQRIREAREYLGLSQGAVADAVGVPRPSISMMESGQRKVSAEELRKLAKLYRKPYEYFLGEDVVDENAESTESVTALFRAAKDLSENDRQQVLRFAEFLRDAGPPPVPDDEDGS